MKSLSGKINESLIARPGGKTYIEGIEFPAELNGTVFDNDGVYELINAVNAQLAGDYIYPILKSTIDNLKNKCNKIYPGWDSKYTYAADIVRRIEQDTSYLGSTGKYENLPDDVEHLLDVLVQLNNSEKFKSIIPKIKEFESCVFFTSRISRLIIYWKSGTADEAAEQLHDIFSKLKTVGVTLASTQSRSIITAEK